MNIRENKGITLIMLIVTIVVILILASVSISAITGGENVIEKGKQAKDETEIKAEMEELQKIINQSAAKGIRHGNYSGSADATTIREALKKNNLIVENPDDVIIDGKNYWKVTGLKTGQKYEIKSDGSVEKSRDILPNCFQQVEYIESTGIQYIDTGVKDEESIKWQIELSFSTINGRRLMGANLGLNFACNNGTLQIGNTNSTISVNTNEVVSIEMERTENARIMKVRDTETVVTNPTGHNNIYICGLDMGGYKWNLSSEDFIGRVYSSKIYKNNLSIRDFIPCYCNTTVTDTNGKQCPSGTKGLYDFVTGKFYTNQNQSGADFTVGPEV